MDTNSTFIIQPRGKGKAKLVHNETTLFDELEKTCKEIELLDKEEVNFPNAIGEINFN
jgi:hypothetical protein